MSAVAAIPRAHLPRAIEASFDVEDPDAVGRYLDRHPSLTPLLTEARRAIVGFFSADARVALELIPDPETIDHVELFAIVRAPLSAEDVLDRLDQFDAE